MDLLLNLRQRRTLILIAFAALLMLDAHALRSFLATREYFAIQRDAWVRMLAASIRREVDARADVFASADAVVDPSVTQPALAQLASRYNLESVEIVDSEGWLVAASQSGRPLMVPEPLPGITREQRKILGTKLDPQYALPSALGTAVPQIAHAYLPFRVASTTYILKITTSDSGLAPLNMISRDIFIYQALGLGSALLLVLMVASWVIGPYRRALRKTHGVTGIDSPSGSTDAPDRSAAVVSSFQGVIAELRVKERTMAETSRAEREKAEAATRVSTDILQQIEDAVVLFSAQGRVLRSNRAASELFGMPPLVLYNQHYAKMFEDDPDWRRVVELAMKEGKKEHDRILPRADAGEERLYRVSASPVPDASGKHGALCMISDVTQRMRLERQVADSEKLAALGEMSRGLAHEVRNSLGTLVGLQRLLAADADTTSDAQGRYLGMMQKEIQDLNRIVTDFLDFTRPIALRPEPVDCASVIERCIEEITVQLPERANDVGVEGEFGEVAGDELLLRQAFFNLIKNGLEAGQAVTVRVSGLVDRSAAELVVRVRDTGCGIAPDDIEKIFIPFYTTKEDGYGIGLALVKKIVLAHNGRIEVESAVDGGTEFQVILPLCGTSGPPASASK